MSSKEQREELSRKYEEEKKNRIYLTKEEVEALTPEEIEEAKVRGAMLGFFEALIDGKTEEAYQDFINRHEWTFAKTYCGDSKACNYYVLGGSHACSRRI